MLSIRRAPVSVETGTSKFDLGLQFEEDESGMLVSSLRYNTDLFEVETMIRMVEQYQTLLANIAADPGQAIREQVLKIKCEPEEIRAYGRELYIYFPNGMARPKLSFATLERTLKIPGTGRNWHSVTKLLEMAEKLEASLV